MPFERLSYSAYWYSDEKEDSKIMKKKLRYAKSTIFNAIYRIEKFKEHHGMDVSKLENWQLKNLLEGYDKKDPPLMDVINDLILSHDKHYINAINMAEHLRSLGHEYCIKTGKLNPYDKTKAKT